MPCQHSIQIGAPCSSCPGGIAVESRKRRRSISRESSLSPPPIEPALPIEHASVHVPFVALTRSTGASSVGSSSDASSGGGSAAAGPISSASLQSIQQIINNLKDYLKSKPENFNLKSSLCDVGAVCWNWVLFGGARASEEDPQWAFLYVSSREPDRSKRRKIAAATSSVGMTASSASMGMGSSETLEEPGGGAMAEAVARLPELSLAKEKLKSAGNFPSVPKIKEVHTLVLTALLKHHGLVVDESSSLKVVLYFAQNDSKLTGINYVHMELLDEANGSVVTITKGNGEQVKAFGGFSVLTVSTHHVAVGIRPSSLKAAHVRVFQDLQTKMS